MRLERGENYRTLQIVKGFPPNISTIRQYLIPPPDAVFAYGAIIYNPTNKDIPPDVYEHEKKHMEQMQGWQPDAWWTKYCLDIFFRQQQEISAFCAQLIWVKNNWGSKAFKFCLEECATNLSSNYGLDLNYNKAFTLLRHRTRSMII